MKTKERKTVQANSTPGTAGVDRDSFIESLSGSRKMGVELEFTFVDRETGAPLPVASKVMPGVPEEIRGQLHLEHLESQIEIVSKPHASLAGVRFDLKNLVSEVEKAAAPFGGELLWSGCHQRLNYAKQLMSGNPRNAQNNRRLGGATEGLGTTGLHMHVEVTRDEAIRVIDGLQMFLPMLVALASNSPVINGRDTGFRSKRVSIWSGQMGVCGLAGPYGDWDDFERQMDDLKTAGRIETMKDNYAFVRPTRFGTVEIRCCDMPMNLEQVIALASAVRTLVEAVAENQFKNVNRTRDFLKAELHEAVLRGPEAILTDHRGLLATPLEWLNRLAFDLQLTAMTIDTDLALRLMPKYLATNGSTEQLAEFKRRELQRVESAPIRKEGTLVAHASLATKSRPKWGFDLPTAATTAAATAALIMLLARLAI